MVKENSFRFSGVFLNNIFSMYCELLTEKFFINLETLVFNILSNLPYPISPTI